MDNGLMDNSSTAFLDKFIKLNIPSQGNLVQKSMQLSNQTVNSFDYLCTKNCTNR